MSPDEHAARAAHHAFYRAFESLSIDEMDATWAHDGQVTCAHPGWPIAIGWTAVRESWDTIFRNTPQIHFEITDEHIEVLGDLAWAVCVENISSGTGGGSILATNVLRRGPDRLWRMVHHHGSQHVPPPKRSLPAAPRRVMN